MILAALKDYYDRAAGKEDGPPPFGFAEVGVVGAIQLRDDGTFINIVPLGDAAQRGKTIKRVPKRMVVPQPPKRTVAVTAGFLCDNAGYFFGLDTKGNLRRALEQFDASRALHAQLLSGVDHPVAAAIRGFFATSNPTSAAERLAGESEELLTGWLVFQHAPSGAYAHEVPVIRAGWERHAAEDAKAVRGQCLVTGDPDVPIPPIHPSVKGVQGAQSSGAALVSFNLDAFTSYGKEQNLNAPIGAEAAFAYTTALNHLLRPDSRQKIRIGDTSVVVWAEVATAAEDAIMAFLGGGDFGDENAAQKVAHEVERIADGRWASEPDFEENKNVRFFVLGLAPNAARLQIRFFFVDTLETLLTRLQQHCRDILFEEPAEGARVPTIRQLVYELFPRDDDGKARTGESDKKKIEKLQAELLRAVLTGHDFPQTLLPAVLGRLRADGGYTRGRLGLVKACLNRNARNSGDPGSEVKMQLDETVDDPGYLLGRLFALLENLQVLSRGGGDSPTIKDRYGSTASVTPRAVFPHLLGLSEAHAKKAKRDKPGIAHNLIRRASELTARFDPKAGGFPALLDLRQQGLFFIGYHQQRQSFFRKGEGPQGAAADLSMGETTDGSEE